MGLPAGVTLSSNVDMRLMSKVRVSIKKMYTATGRGKWRRYPENVKMLIGKMAVERGYEDTMENWNEMGLKIHNSYVFQLKNAYLSQKKGQCEEGADDIEGEDDGKRGEDDVAGGEEQVHGGVSNAHLQVGQVNMGEESITNQEQEETINEEGDLIQEQLNVGEGSTIDNQEIINDAFKGEDYLNQVFSKGLYVWCRDLHGGVSWLGQNINFCLSFLMTSLFSWPGQFLSLNPCRRPKILARMLFLRILSLTVVIADIKA